MTEYGLLAVLGGQPLFAHPLHPGQRFLPDWASYEAMFRDIFERQYYTNQGPLAQRLEDRVADYLGVRHAVCMTNDFVGLLSLTFALGVNDRVVVPALCPRSILTTLPWAGVRPVLCDVNAATGLASVALVEQALAQSRASAILTVNPWGDACPMAELEALAARHSVALYSQSAHGFGCAIGGRRLGGFARAEVISFHADNVLNALEGCVVATGDDDVAAYLRNMRSSYGMGRPFPVPRTTNGRMSEAQAAMALFALDHLDQRIARNRHQFVAFQSGLARVPGISVRTPQGVDASNHQNLICIVDEAEFGLSRDEIIRVLSAENIVARPALGMTRALLDTAHSMVAPNTFPNAVHYASRTLELPLGASVTDANVNDIVERVALVQASAASIRRHFECRA